MENITNLSSLPVEDDVDLSWNHVKTGFDVAGIILTPTILIIGIFGNTMTILTVLSKSFADLASRYILVALAISDTTLILTQPFNKLFVRDLLGFDARALSYGGCKFFFWLFKTAKMTSSWLIVILCFERFVAVMFPLKRKHIITKTSVLIMILCDYAIIGGFNGIWTFSSLIQNGVCKPDVVFPATKQKYRNYLLVGLSLLFFIPMGLMVIFTPVIVWKLIQKRQKRQNVLRNGKPDSKKDSKEIRASLVLIGVVAAFILLVLPITIVFMLTIFHNVSAFDTNTMDFFVVREIAQILEQLNYSINFFLYIMCSETFRRRALQLIRRPFGKNRVSPSSEDGATYMSSVDKTDRRRIAELSFVSRGFTTKC